MPSISQTLQLLFCKGVLAVGYGHYDPKTDPNAAPDAVESDYWLIKNSWGERWGLNGCECIKYLKL